MSKFLDNLELKLRQILEGSVEGLFYPGVSSSLSSQITELFQKAILKSQKKTGSLPDLIKLHVSPEKIGAWQDVQGTLDEVCREIIESLRDEPLDFDSPLRIKLLADEFLDVDEIRVEAASASEMQITTATAIKTEDESPSRTALPNQACLIIRGEEPVMLTTPIISIGRHSSNDIVIQDPQVSRKHLQLRAEKGYFIVFDLSSTGGTLINKKRVRSAKLKPGDVIQVGRTLMIYSHEQGRNATGTRVLSQMGADGE